VRITWAGTFEPEFNRNMKIARLLERVGVEVSVTRVSVWGDSRVDLASTGKARALVRIVAAVPRLLWQLLWSPRPDAYLVSYPGWFDVPVVWVASRFKRAPIVFDPFISLFDTMILDRAMYTPSSWVGRLVRLVDRLALRLADIVIADTSEHLKYYDTLVPGVSDRGGVIPVGADDTVFRPVDEVTEGRTVLFYGTFVPLQGAATVVEAAHRLNSDDVKFLLVGDGQDRPAVERLMIELGVTNVELVGPVPLETLPAVISGATICLGIFGDSDKAARVVPNKVYECVAMGMPVITRSSPAIDSAFAESDLIRVPARDPKALADAIRSLLADSNRRESIGAAGRLRYEERFCEVVIAETLEAVLTKAIRQET